MNEKHNNSDSLKSEAQRLTAMINVLTLFTRRTLLEWLPEISSTTGVTSEWFSVMFELRIKPDQSLKDLSLNLMASPPNVSVMIQSMVEEGVVLRITDPKDRRRVLLRLSDEGERLYNLVERQFVSKYQEYLESLSIADRKDLDHAAQHMISVTKRILKLPLV